MDSTLILILIITSALIIGAGAGAGTVFFAEYMLTLFAAPQERETVGARLKRLGFETSGSLYFEDHQDDVFTESAYFFPQSRPLFKADERGAMHCRRCLTAVMYVRFTGSQLYTSTNQLFPNRLKDNTLGIFCLQCSVGSWTQHGKLPQRTTLKERLDDFEKRVAFYKLAKPSQEATPEPGKSFNATVEGTGGFRHPPMQVRVDPDTRTVRPLEAESEPAEAELEGLARNAASKALPS